MNVNRGSDELILHIRKNYKNCDITNDKLGKKIWKWPQENDPSAEILNRDRLYEWDNSSEITFDITLSKKSTRFRISRNVIPQLCEQ